MNQKISTKERDLAISKYSLLLQAIESGSYEYSPAKLKADLDAYKLTTWVQIHPILTALIFLACCLLGGIPAIIFVAILFLQKAGRERYEVALLKLKRDNFSKR